MVGLELVAAAVLAIFLLRLLVHVGSRLLRRPLLWAWERLRTRMEQPDLTDTAANELALVVQRERLCRNLDRVELLMATDDWMSATRQLGNRMAHRRLLLELRQLPDGWAASASPAASWMSETGRPRGISAGAREPVARVEVLEIGLRHG